MKIQSGVNRVLSLAGTLASIRQRSMEAATSEPTEAAVQPEKRMVQPESPKETGEDPANTAVNQTVNTASPEQALNVAQEEKRVARRKFIDYLPYLNKEERKQLVSMGFSKREKTKAMNRIDEETRKKIEVARGRVEKKWLETGRRKEDGNG